MIGCLCEGDRSVCAGRHDLRSKTVISGLEPLTPLSCSSGWFA